MFSRRDGLLAAALILLLAAVWLLLGPRPSEGDAADRRLSTFHTSSFGARALYLTLQELDVPASRRLTAITASEGSAPGALALLAPTEPPTPLELSALHSWVEAGGTLLYAARPGDPTLDTLGLSLQELAPDTLSAFQRRDWEGLPVRAGPHRWTEGIQTAATARFVFSDSSDALSTSTVTPLLITHEEDLVAVTLLRGQGRIVAWSDPGLLSNRMLREGGRPLVFVRAAAEITAEGDTLAFDEYHQGYRAGGGPVRATLRFARETPSGRTTLQLAVVGLGLLLLCGRRFGSPIESVAGRRRSPLEHVDALSGAYRQAGARSTARRLLIAGLARRLGRDTPRVGAEAAFLERASDHLPSGRAEAERLLEEWKKGDGADLCVLARGVDAIVAATRGPLHAPDNQGEDNA